MQMMQRLRRHGVGIAHDRTIRELAELMNESGVGSIAVLDGDTLVGMVTDRDVVRRAVARGLPPDARIDGIMSSPAYTVDADADVAEAVAAFGTHAVRRLAVVDHGRFVGVVSLDDLLVDLGGELVMLLSPLASEVAAPQRTSPPPATIPTN